MSKPKILVVDVETMAAKGWFWKLFDENISVNQVESPPRILCWAAKWVGQHEIMQVDERKGRADMLIALRTLITEADAVVTYNGDKFDLRKINGELFVEGLRPLPPVTSIDLIKTVRQLGLLSNRLEFLAIVAKIGQKIKHAGFDLWRGCAEGDKAAWDKMLRYNAQDVRLTERAYKRLLPFIRNHPRLGTLERTKCPSCGSGHSQARGYRRTRATWIQRFQCLMCGGWFDGKRELVK